ncbi:MAG: GFA family protein [Rhodospirillales bacterium]|nr:GFA family protein [Rhodospirillales bacterium]
MKVEGGCYCGALRYVAEGEPQMKAQCHCRECQYLSGGHPNVIMGMLNAGFSYTKGEPKKFTRSDLETARTREFCSECGTHILTRSPSLPDGVLLKVGTFDDPSLYQGPDVAIQTADKQSFHHVPDDIPSFERFAKK